MVVLGPTKLWGDLRERVFSDCLNFLIMDKARFTFFLNSCEVFFISFEGNRLYSLYKVMSLIRTF